MEAPSELLLEAHRDFFRGAPKGAAMDFLKVATCKLQLEPRS